MNSVQKKWRYECDLCISWKFWKANFGQTFLALVFILDRFLPKRIKSLADPLSEWVKPPLDLQKG